MTNYQDDKEKMIKISKLTKKYQNRIALDNISCNIASGGVVGFLGPNGAGKTTLMRHITGFLAPTSGQVFVDNKDVRENSLAIKNLIGYLPENNPLYLDLIAKNYLKFISSLQGVDNKTFQSRLDSVAKVCGIREVLNRSIGHLSKGFKQRVGLAGTMLHNPKILILDEPTSGLDPNQIMEIRELIKYWGQKKTIILSTHILSEVEAICDQVIILNKGKIVAKGQTQDLLKGQGKNQEIKLSLKADKQMVGPVFNKEDDIESVIQLDSSESGVSSFKLSIKPKKDLRERIFKLCVQNNWPILEIVATEKRLEEVFRDLTK